MMHTILMLAAAAMAAPTAAPAIAAETRDDLTCAATMMASADPVQNPSADASARSGAAMALQFFLGRLTATGSNRDWVAETSALANVLAGTGASNLVVPCLARKATLLRGAGRSQR